MPQAIRASEATASVRTGYPVPDPVKPPKHLFHVVVRYEGEGLSESSVTELVKSVGGEVVQKPDAKTEATKTGNPRALFNFVIRYEGEGLIDSNVVELVKNYIDAQTREAGPNACVAVLPVPPPPPDLPPGTVQGSHNRYPMAPFVQTAPGTAIGSVVGAALASPAAQPSSTPTVVTPPTSAPTRPGSLPQPSAQPSPLPRPEPTSDAPRAPRPVPPPGIPMMPPAAPH
jgi:hypothetical protein